MSEPRIPYDPAAEQALLGGLIAYPQLVAKMPSALEAAWFDADNRRIYAALKHLGPETTPIMLARFLDPSGSPEQLRWASIIFKMASNFPLLFDETYLWYANDVLRLAERRAHMEQGAQMVADAWTDKPEPKHKKGGAVDV